MEENEYRIMYRMEAEHWWFKGKRKIVFSQLRRLIKNRKNIKFLDIGCGTGIMMKEFLKWGEASGIDIEWTALDFCSKRKIHNVMQADLMKMPFKEGSFDVAGAFDVLYHKSVKKDTLAMKEIFRILKPGGMLILTDSADIKIISRHDIATHTRERYTIPKLSSRLEYAGFSIIKISYFNTFLFPLVFIVRLLDNIINKSKPAASNVKRTNPLLNFVLYAIFVLESRLLKHINLPFGVSVFAIAKKPF